jgi:hypothetical protein
MDVFCFSNPVESFLNEFFPAVLSRELEFF